jgi:hypothetical protein
VDFFLRWARNQWDRLGAWVAIGAGALLLIFGWLGISRVAFTEEQLPYLASGGLGGLFLLGVGAMLWLSADLRDEWRKLDRLEALLTAGQSTDDEELGAAPHPNGDTDTNGSADAAPRRRWGRRRTAGTR